MDRRTEYTEKLSAQIVQWDVQIDLLKEQAERVTPETGFEHATLIAASQLKLHQAAIELQGISMASDDKWKDLKAGEGELYNQPSNTIYRRPKQKDSKR